MATSLKSKIIAGIKDRTKRQDAGAKKSKSKKSRHGGDNFYERSA